MAGAREAIRANGVRVDTPEGSTTPSLRIFHLCAVATLRDPFDLVLVVVKAYDTRWSCELVRPLLAPDGLAVGSGCLGDVDRARVAEHRGGLLLAAAGTEALDTALALGHRIVPMFGQEGIEETPPERYAAGARSRREAGRGSGRRRPARARGGRCRGRGD